MAGRMLSLDSCLEYGRPSGAFDIEIEILSIGRQFRELDMRRLAQYIKRPPFYKSMPM